MDVGNLLDLEKVSPSSIRTYLGDSYELYRQKILKDMRFEKSVNMVLGSAMHKCLETFYETDGDIGEVAKQALQDGYDTLHDEYNSGELKSNVKESEEKLQSKLKFVFTKFLEEAPDFPEVLGTELDYERHFNHMDGTESALPLRGILDILYRNKDGDAFIVDYKIVNRHTSEISPLYYLQAVAYYHLMSDYLQETPKSQLYMEIKHTENRDGGSQVKYWEIDFASEEFKEALQIFDILFQRMVLNLAGAEGYYPVPNITSFDAAYRWDAFRDELNKDRTKECEEYAKVAQEVDNNLEFVHG